MGANEMKCEIWNDVKGYEGLYKVSNKGRIWSEYSQKVKKPTLQNGGYLLVFLIKNKKRKAALVHRLVAEAFIDNPNGLAEVNHKDGIKTNNTIDNLEWCSRSDNLRHRSRVLGQRGNAKQIMCVETGAVFEAIKDAGKWAGVTGEAIHSSLKRTGGKSGGYTWKII
jgi:hypothetical protein